MIRLGTQIRLATRDIERITMLTGVEPAAVLSVDALDAFLDDQVKRIRGESQCAQILRALIERERVKLP